MFKALLLTKPEGGALQCAITDLEEAAQAVTLASQAQSIVDDVAALKEMVHDLAAGRKAVK